MNIKDYYKQNGLLNLKKGTPVLISSVARNFERFDLTDPVGNEIRHYVFKWGGMQDGGFEGFSREGRVAYSIAQGEIFKLYVASDAWNNKPMLTPVRTVDDKGLSYLLLEHIPESIYIGKDEIISGIANTDLKQTDLKQYKTILEELL